MSRRTLKNQEQRLIQYKHGIYMTLTAIGYDRTSSLHMIETYEGYIQKWLGSNDIPVVTEAMAARMIARAFDPNGNHGLDNGFLKDN